MQTQTGAPVRGATAAPVGRFRSRAIERLLRFEETKSGVNPPPRRMTSPSGVSTFTTSAPWSASIIVAFGPETTLVRSSHSSGPWASPPSGARPSMVASPAALVMLASPAPPVAASPTS